MAKSPTVVVSRNRGRLECDVCAIPDWDGLEKLAHFLEKHYGATILERVDGPDARCWTARVRGVTIELQHEDPWGNVIVASDAASESTVREIADDLTHRLAGLPADAD